MDTRLPPTLPRGSCFALEPEQEGKSFLTKQTLVIERATLLSIGGFDERFRARVHTELFLRLNPVYSLQGIERVTYRRYLHEQRQLSREVRLRQESFRQLVEAHASVLRAKPKGYARMLTDHARKSREMGQYGAAAKAALEALRYAPIDTARRMAGRSFIAETVRQGFRRLRG